MRNRVVSLLLMAVCGCSTTATALKSPIAVQASERSRTEVADCLLNRLASDDMKAQVDRGTSETVITFRHALDFLGGQPLWVFTVKDNGTGSVTEMRRSASTVGGRQNAETCF